MDFPALSSIKKRRLRLDLSQKRLANLCGIGQSYLTKVERGRAAPSYTIAVRIFQALDLLESKEAEKAPEETAGDVMTINLLAFGPDEGAENILEAMTAREISQVPVIGERGFQEGTITERTLLGKDLTSLTARQVMDSHTFPVVSRDTRLPLLIDILQEEPAILVGDRTRIIGIITKQDILRKGRSTSV